MVRDPFLETRRAREPQCKVDDATVCHKWTSSVQMLTPAGKRRLEKKRWRKIIDRFQWKVRPRRSQGDVFRKGGGGGSPGIPLLRECGHPRPGGGTRRGGRTN